MQRRLICGALAIAALSLPRGATAQESLADQKLRADIAKVQTDTQAALLKQQLDVLASLKGVAEGKTTLTGVNVSAEAIQIGDYALRATADKLAEEVNTWKTANPSAPGSLLLVMGSQKPTVADYLAFDTTITLLDKNLKRAIELWELAEEIGSGLESTGPDLAGPPELVGAVLPLISAIGSVASLFNVDREISGAAYSTSDAQMAAVTQAALHRKAIGVDLTTLEFDQAPDVSRSRLDQIRPTYEEADRLYRTIYLKEVAKAGGKPDSLPPQKAAAGKNLETVTADFRALESKLFTPVNGLLPAAEIDRQKRLVDASATKPILYIRSYHAAVTTVTRRGFLIGRGTTPARMKAAALIDYALILNDRDSASRAAPLLGTVHFTTGAVPFDTIDRHVCQGFAPNPATYAACTPAKTSER